NLRAQGMAFFGYGGGSSTFSDRPKRVFYGTLTRGTAYATRTRCPVAYGATSVMVVGGRQSGATNFTVAMLQQPNPALGDPAFADLISGAQPANVEVPLTANDGWIYVTSPDNTSTSDQEIPFEIHYFMGL